MARRDYLPDTDSAFLAWTDNFSTKLTAAPTTYGITAEIASAYAAKQTDFATKLAAATNPDTRGKRTVFLKDEAKQILAAATRPLAVQIGKTMSVTDAQRQELGLTIAKPPTPKPAPAAQPRVMVSGVSGRTATIELWRDVRKRGKAANATGAMIFTYEGDTAPLDPSDWQFAMSTTKTIETLSFGPSATGTKFWITASWVNAKLETGPGATAVSVNLPAGGVMPRASENATPQTVLVRKAA